MKESEKFPNYFYIPNHSMYVINRDGDIIKEKTGRHISYRRNSSGYHTCSLVHDNGHRGQMFRHRALCTTFKPHPNSKSMQVDHINTDKNDDRLENLEWVTGKENCRRAAANGLYAGSRPVLVRDYKTKLVTRYESMASAARELGMLISAIQYRLERNDGRLYPDGRQYLFEDLFKGWPDAKDVESEMESFGTKKRVLLRDLRSGLIREFERITDAAKFLKISPSLLSTRLSSVEHPVLPGLYQAKLKMDTREWRSPSDPIRELAEASSTSLTVAINRQRKIKQIFVIQRTCAHMHKLLVNTLNYRLKYGTPGRVYENGWEYRYYNIEEDGSTTSDFHVEYFFD